MKKFFRLWLIVGMLMSLTGFFIKASAQDELTSKPYQQWTMKDVEKLLSDSAWAQTKSKGMAVGFNNPIFQSGATFAPDDLILRLRSAMPIRQAILRLRQLKSKYDKMSDADKAAFDTKQKPLLECAACADNYVIALSPPLGRDKGIPTNLRTMSFESIKMAVHLTNEKGEERGLVHFVAPKTGADEALFFFSRFNEKGEPLITPSNKTLVVSFDQKIFGSDTMTITKFEFDVSKLVANGEVLF